MGKIIKCINVVVMSMERINRDGRTSLVAQTVKNPLAIWETWVQSLGWEDPLEKGMATHSSILSWRIPWTGGACTVHGVAKSQT